MDLVLALGSNIGNKKENLLIAKEYLEKHFCLVKASKIISSKPVDYLKQDDFLNQVIQFNTTIEDEEIILKITQEIESLMGRVKTIPKGPRNIDIDIIFLGRKKINKPHLIIPHPEWKNREFVKGPLKELPISTQGNLFL